MKKPETRREKWKKRWYIGTPQGGSVLSLQGMDGERMVGMDGETLKPMER